MPITAVSLVRTSEGGYIIGFSDGREHQFVSAQQVREAYLSSALRPDVVAILLAWCESDPTLSHASILYSITSEGPDA